MRIVTAVLFAVVASGGLAPRLSAQVAPAAPTIVILVRHAEKAAAPANDPPLTARGTERAAALSEALREAQVAAVYHTPTLRTRDTARPVAARFGLTPQLIPMAPRGAQGDSIVAIARRHPGQTIVLVGHSNTIMPWLAALGGPTRPDLCDHEYDGLFTAILDGKTPRVIDGRYGPPNPTQATGTAMHCGAR
ncbi:MAG: histidine phosphatase family protein [Gemmatimonadaceae bacterium]|jgi:phosphohistidine phosphatase SixA